VDGSIGWLLLLGRMSIRCSKDNLGKIFWSCYYQTASRI
jgi:hypothetical protein